MSGIIPPMPQTLLQTLREYIWAFPILAFEIVANPQVILPLNQERRRKSLSADIFVQGLIALKTHKNLW